MNRVRQEAGIQPGDNGTSLASSVNGGNIQFSMASLTDPSRVFAGSSVASDETAQQRGPIVLRAIFAYTRAEIVAYIRSCPSFLAEEGIEDHRVYWTNRATVGVMLNCMWTNDVTNTSFDEDRLGFRLRRGEFTEHLFFSEVDIAYFLQRMNNVLISPLTSEMLTPESIQAWKRTRARFIDTNWEDARNVVDPHLRVPGQSFTWVELVGGFLCINGYRYMSKA